MAKVRSRTILAVGLIYLMGVGKISTRSKTTGEKKSRTGRDWCGGGEVSWLPSIFKVEGEALPESRVYPIEL
jgi:hypothetical protein